jgi:phosphatidylethanolamine/phosphatidyl-N-methylethanolamine N-methyltransferase
MPKAVSDSIAAAIAQVLRPGGRFVAYQVRGHVADFVAPYLGEPDRQWEMVNVPPVRVYTWIKPAH